MAWKALWVDPLMSPSDLIQQQIKNKPSKYHTSAESRQQNPVVMSSKAMFLDIEYSSMQVGAELQISSARHSQHMALKKKKGLITSAVLRVPELWKRAKFAT